MAVQCLSTDFSSQKGVKVFIEHIYLIKFASIYEKNEIMPVIECWLQGVASGLHIFQLLTAALIITVFHKYVFRVTFATLSTDWLFTTLKDTTLNVQFENYLKTNCWDDINNYLKWFIQF